MPATLRCSCGGFLATRRNLAGIFELYCVDCDATHDRAPHLTTVGKPFGQQALATFPASLQARGFADHSWSNDAAARAALSLTGASETQAWSESSYPALYVWCSPDIVNEREDESYARYVVEHVSTEVEDGHGLNIMLETESEEEMLAEVDRLTALHHRNHPTKG